VRCLCQVEFPKRTIAIMNFMRSYKIRLENSVFGFHKLLIIDSVFKLLPSSFDYFFIEKNDIKGFLVCHFQSITHRFNKEHLQIIAVL
jgi:hypothetical protein